jgi:type IV fimbrial biogenesis protein FimT
MNLNRQAGMTLIELMIGIVLLGILLALGVPTFSRWVQSSQIRNAAEAIHNGLMLARAEAVRRNTTVRFQFVTTTTGACALSDTGTNWVVSLDSPVGACDAAPSDNVAPRIVQVRSATEGSRNAVVNAGGVSWISFNGTGGAIINGNPATPAAAINVTNPTGGTCAAAGPMRCMRVTVATGGQIRMCDPARAAGDPQGC